MDMVTAQRGLSQGGFLKEIQIHNPNNGNVEEEVDLQASAPSPQNRRASADDGGDHPEESPSLRRQLLTAVRQDDAPGVLQYVADGAEVSLINEAMRLAAHRGSSAVVRELVAVGLSVNEVCSQTGFTPLQLAAVSGHIVVCELLLDALADVHRPVGGATALTLARKMGNVEVEEVIERHVASLMLTDQGESDEAAHYRRAHVLPRVSPTLSEAVMQALPPPPVFSLVERQVATLLTVEVEVPSTIASKRPAASKTNGKRESGNDVGRLQVGASPSSTGGMHVDSQHVLPL